MPKPDTQVEETVLDEAAVKAIADQVAAGMAGSIASAVDAAVEKKLAASEKTVKKNVSGKTKSPNDDDEEEGDEDAPESEAAKASKEQRLVRAAMALVRGDSSTLRELNQYAMDQRTKAGYANTDVNADGGYIVADPEFEAEIEKLAPEYGVAFTDADVRPISRNSVKTNKRGSNVTMYETGQGAKKTGTKLTIDQILVELRKFAAIAIATDELEDDAAIDFWNEVTQGFAEERARIADELVFTDDGGSLYNQTGVGKGIFETAGVHTLSVGSSITDISWDDLMDAEAKVPSRAQKNGKHYMHRTVWNSVRQTKDSGTGAYLLPLNAGYQTPWGTPVVTVDVLPSTVEGGSNNPYTVFGDLKRVKLYVKRGLVLDQLKEATVTDADGNEVNLAEQDMTALRAVTRMVALVKFPEAFCVIGTGSVS
jgi:HK97 family phage major capsid protein